MPRNIRRALPASPIHPLLSSRADIWWLALAWPALKLLPASDAIALPSVEPIMQTGSTKLPACAACEMSNTTTKQIC
jgi:hypothetical protein